MSSIAKFSGITIKIPNGYHETEDGTYINGHGVEYGLVQYEKDGPVYLESLSKYDRRILLKTVETTSD
jgi:hypothetical protein